MPLTQFDPERDSRGDSRNAGCFPTQGRCESIDIHDIMKTAIDDRDALSSEVKVLHGLKFESLLAVYRQFCKNEDKASVDLAEVIRFYNGAVADLPDHSRLKGARIAESGGILDARGERFADLTESNRRVWVPLRDIPVPVQKAFIAAEDRRFYEHKGVDERGLVRAMVSNLARPGRPQGGSTITQQVVKNLLVGDDVTYERKMREIIVASRLERSLTGRRSGNSISTHLPYAARGELNWRPQLFRQTGFALTLQEAMLAGMPGADLLQPGSPSRSRPGAARLRGEPDGRRRCGRHGDRRRQGVVAANDRLCPAPATDSVLLDHVTRAARSLAGRTHRCRHDSNHGSSGLQRATEAAGRRAWSSTSRAGRTGMARRRQTLPRRCGASRRRRRRQFRRIPWCPM